MSLYHRLNNLLKSIRNRFLGHRIEPDFIYKSGERKKALALRRLIDHQTGLSFNYKYYGAKHYKFNIKRLRRAGFTVRVDEHQPVTLLFSDQPYIEPNTGESVKFDEGHVTVFLPVQREWDEWYRQDVENVGTQQSSTYLDWLYSLREPDSTGR